MKRRNEWPKWLRELRRRGDRDFQFAMIMSFGMLAMLSISIMQVLRFVRGEWLGGMINLAIVPCVGAVLVYAWRSGQTRRAGLLFALVTVTACIVSGAYFGRTGILWGYVVLWVNFVLTQRQAALVLNGVLIAGLAITSELFVEVVEVTIYLMTSSLVSVFGYIFAARLDSQQTQLEAMAGRDPLTGIGNRRSMRRALVDAIARARSTDGASSLVLMDLDHFKRLNDEHGHDAGDQALRGFVSSVGERIRDEDEFFRFGGEEFLLLLQDADYSAAQQMATDLHRRISGVLPGPGGPISFSAGVATLEPDEDWESWVRRADQALYQAKREGRNRLVLAK